MPRFQKAITYRIYSGIKSHPRYKTHPDLALPKAPLLAKPAYKTHLNGELRKTFFKVKTGGEIHDFTIGSNYYHKNIVNTWSIKLYPIFSQAKKCYIAEGPDIIKRGQIEHKRFDIYCLNY